MFLRIPRPPGAARILPRPPGVCAERVRSYPPFTDTKEFGKITNSPPGKGMLDKTAKEVNVAGRPRMMATRVTPLEDTAYQLYRDLCRVRPAQYAARQDAEEDTQDELCLSWNEAAQAVLEAWECLQELLELLEQRAKLPYQLLYLQRARSRSLLNGRLGQPVEEPVGSGRQGGLDLGPAER